MNIWQRFWVYVLKQIYKYRAKYGYRTAQQAFDCYTTIYLELDMIIKILEIQYFDVNEYHPLQFIDEDQVVGARKKLDNYYQLHVRMYGHKKVNDYSVHAHIEFIPEKAPLRHILGYKMRDGCEEFMEQWENIPLKKP